MRKFIACLLWGPLFLIISFITTLLVAIVSAKIFPEAIEKFNTEKPNSNLLEFYNYFIGSTPTMLLYVLVYCSPLLAIALCIKGKLPFSKPKKTASN